jgi:hypothetical protein
MTRERTESRSSQSERLVASDVFLHRLERSTLDALRRALELGLVPSSLDFGGDDGSIVRLRLTRTRAG